MTTGYGGKDREDRYGGKDREDRYDRGDRYDRQGKGDRYGEHRYDNRGDGDDRRGNTIAATAPRARARVSSRGAPTARAVPRSSPCRGRQSR